MQQPDEESKSGDNDRLMGTASYLIRVKMTILLNDSWKPSLLLSPSSGGDTDERELPSNHHHQLLPFPDGAIADSIAAMMTGAEPAGSPAEVTIINATVIADTATVHVWVSVPVQNRPDAQLLIGIPPPEVRQHLLAAGLQGIKWAGLSNHELLSSNEVVVNQVPMVFFGSAFIASIVFMGSLAALDPLRSSVGWCMGRRNEPVHSELLLPPVAVASLAAFVTYVVKSLSTSSAGGIIVAASWLPVAAFSCVGATLLFNACAMSLLVIVSWEHPRGRIYVTGDNSSRGTAAQQQRSPTATSMAMLPRDQQQGDVYAAHHHHRRQPKHPNRWIFCIAALAAMANVGCLKVLTCGVADWCSFPESRRRKLILSVLGLVASLVGDVAFITIIVLDQQNLYLQASSAAANGPLWPVLPRVAVVLSGNVILLSAISVVRTSVQQMQLDRQRQLLEFGDGSYSAGGDSSPTEIFLSRFQSQCSSPAAPVAESRQASSATPSPNEIGRASGALICLLHAGMNPLCSASPSTTDWLWLRAIHAYMFYTFNLQSDFASTYITIHELC